MTRPKTGELRRVQRTVRAAAEMNVALANDVFLESFTHQRNLTRPAELVRFGKLAAIRDSRPDAKPRAEEIVLDNLSPVDALKVLAAYGPGRHSAMFYADPSEMPALKSAYRELGYRYFGSEPLMVHDLAAVPGITSEATVHIARTPDEMAAISKLARITLTTPDEHTAGRIRLYYATVGDEVVGWVRNLKVHAAGGYVSNMLVRPEYRRKGIGSALMSRLLGDAAEHEDGWSVLLASKMGTGLYASLGYATIATLQMFGPKDGTG